MSSSLQMFASLVLIATLLQYSLALTFNLGDLPITIPIGLNPLNSCYRNSADSAPICDWNTIWTDLPIPYPNLPGAGDDVIIAPSTPIILQLTGSVTIDSLQISQSTTLNVSTTAVFILTKNITVSASSTLFVGGQLTVGTVANIAGTLTIVVGGVYTGAINVASGAVLTVDDQTQAAATTSAQLIITADSYINGAAYFFTYAVVNVTNSAALWVYTTLDVYGNVNIDASASIDIVSAGGYTQSNNTITINGYITTPTLYNFGTIKGNGAINGTVYNSAIISPGNSPGTLIINGDYRQTDSSTYTFEIESANNYDRIIVTGTCYRAGTLYANIDNGWNPSPHQEFNIITHQHAQGTYLLVRGNIDDATFDQFSVIYSDTQTTVVFSSAISTFVTTSLVILLPFFSLILM